MTFQQALVLALCLFGVWSLREIAFTAGQVRTLHMMVAALFLILAAALGFFIPLTR